MSHAQKIDFARLMSEAEGGPFDSFSTERWLAEWQTRVAAEAAEGSGLDAFRHALEATRRIDGFDPTAAHIPVPPSSSASPSSGSVKQWQSPQIGGAV